MNVWNNLGAIASVGLFVIVAIPLILRFMLQGMIRSEIEKVASAFTKRIAKLERRISRLEDRRVRRSRGDDRY
jgi:hypothetical protein